MTWTVRDIERDRETIDAIEGHDDRSAAIVAGAYLQDRLASLLAAHNIKPPTSFRGKIDTAYQQRILTDKVAERLHIIREIRNEFAHSLSGLTFASPSIIVMCGKLFSVEQFRALQESTDETFPDCSGMVKLIALLVSPMVELPKTPRNTYMNAVKFFLFYFQLFKATTLMGEDDVLEIVTEYALAGRNK